MQITKISILSKYIYILNNPFKIPTVFSVGIDWLITKFIFKKSKGPSIMKYWERKKFKICTPWLQCLLTPPVTKRAPCWHRVTSISTDLHFQVHLVFDKGLKQSPGEIKSFQHRAPGQLDIPTQTKRACTWPDSIHEN